jgi:gluconolactonase
MRHGTSRGSRLFPILAALIAAGTGSFCFGQGIVSLPASLADASAKVEGVKTGLTYCEGPTWDKSSTFYFSEMQTTPMRIWKITPQGVATILRSGPYFNGNECDPQGRLVYCMQDAVTRQNGNGGLDTLAKSNATFKLKSTNDLSIATNGAMYFTNHDDSTFFYCSPTGVLKKWGGYAIPNGIEWIEEKSLLYLCLSGTNQVLSFSVAADGSVSNQKKFVSVPVPDGITIDERYNVYVASYLEGKVYVFDSTGTQLGTITVQGTPTAQGNVSNCVFGVGTDNKTLYITGNGGAYKVKLLMAGRVKGGSSIVARPRVFANKNPTYDDMKPARYDLRGRALTRRGPAPIAPRVEERSGRAAALELGGQP